MPVNLCLLTCPVAATASLAGHEQLANDDLAAAAISYQHALRCDSRHYHALWVLLKGDGTAHVTQVLQQLHTPRDCRGRNKDTCIDPCGLRKDICLDPVYV